MPEAIERRRRARARRAGGRGGGAAALALVVAAAAPAAAQDFPPPAVVVMGGAFRYDLRGTGTVPFAALRLDLPMSAHLWVEPGLVYARYTDPAGAHIPHLTAEVQVQGTHAFGRWRPYLGAGAGAFLDLRAQRGGSELMAATFSAAAGLRVGLVEGWGARAELRVRAADEDFTGSVAEWGVGISRTF